MFTKKASTFSKLLFSSSVLASSVIFAAPTYAVPTLQLDILGGSYDNTDESVFLETDGSGELAAYCSPGNKNNCSMEHFISIAILDANGNGVDAGTDFGSFLFNGTTYNTNALTYGIPPLEAAPEEDKDDGDLAKHGVFPTLFAEVGFDFSGDTRDVVNVQDNPGTTADTSQSDMFFETFNFDVSGLNEGWRLHFDLYNEEYKGADRDVDDFAPFSHDAYVEMTGGNEPPRRVPEPTSILALGLIGGGMFLSRRKKG